MSTQSNTIHETIADIAYIAGTHGYYSGDSRADMTEFIFLANQFEEKHANVDWEETELDYIIEIENFTQENLRLRKKLDFTPAAATIPWNKIEIERILEEDDDCVPLSPKDKETEDFWSLYLRQVDGSAACIADLPSKEHAKALKKLLENAVKSFQQVNPDPVI